MTDKQIIIDGVDISGCEKQGETIAGITCGNGERIRLANEIITKHKLCKDNPNCVYKQLARKEQECEELEHKLKQAEEKLKQIREFATALCYTVMSDGVVILQKDILKIIDEVE